jgi:hypothetical protein
MKHASFQEVLVNSVTSGVIPSIEAFTVIFPLFPDVHESLVDLGLCLPFWDLKWIPSPEALSSVLSLLACIAEASAYARDAILCLGVHTALIETALSAASENLIVSAVRALHKVFSNRAPIDTSTVTAAVEPMSQLLSLSSPDAVFIAIQCFQRMTTKTPAVVFTMYDLGLFPTVVGMLSNSSLVRAALPLVGNLALGEAAHVETLLQCDLIGVLRGLVRAGVYPADVLWALSNLVESVPRLASAFADPEFVAALTATSAAAVYDVKKETGFLIATLIVVADETGIATFATPEVFELMEEMLECSVALIVVRCIDALLRLARHGNADALGGIGDTLRGLLQHTSAVIGEKAELLLSQIAPDSKEAGEQQRRPGNGALSLESASCASFA